MTNNFPPSPWAPEHVEFLRQRAKEGWSASQISRGLMARFNVAFSRSAVLGKADRMPGVQIGAHGVHDGLRATGSSQFNKQRKEARAEAKRIVDLHADQFIGLLGEPPEEGHCHFVIDNAGAQQACGHKSDRNKKGRHTLYCAFHQTVMYQPHKKRNADSSTGRQRQDQDTGSLQVS
jgi:hypothetical protein